jgi:hypothetical protein
MLEHNPWQPSGTPKLTVAQKMVAARARPALGDKTLPQ